MPKKKKKIEFRYYKMPEGSSILALLGEKWVKPYGKDVDYLHFHNYLEIGYCYSGEGTLTLGEKNYPFTGDEISIIPQNYPHTTDSAPGTVSKWEYLFVDVEGILKELYQKAGSLQRMNHLLNRINSKATFQTTKEAPELAVMTKKLLEIMRNTKEFYMEEAKGIMVALLISIARENQGEKKPAEISDKMTIPISRALDYITLHYMEPLKVDELAKWTHISETHFRRIFSDYMHMGPLEYINLVRIQAACNYLKNTDDPISDIAGKCGFSTLSTFNRNFKHMIGISPSEWRKRPENYQQQLLKSWIHTEEGW